MNEKYLQNCQYISFLIIIVDAFIKHRSAGKTTCSKALKSLKYSHHVVKSYTNVSHYKQLIIHSVKYNIAYLHYCTIKIVNTKCA